MHRDKGCKYWHEICPYVDSSGSFEASITIVLYWFCKTLGAQASVRSFLGWWVCTSIHWVFWINFPRCFPGTHYICWIVTLFNTWRAVCKLVPKGPTIYGVTPCNTRTLMATLMATCLQSYTPWNLTLCSPYLSGICATKPTMICRLIYLVFLWLTNSKCKNLHKCLLIFCILVRFSHGNV